jgi:hypothetical protein
MTTMPFFFNQCLDKKRLKKLILWSLSFQGEYKTLQLIEDLKNLGFQYATSAGVSLSIDDLLIPPKKCTEVLESEALVLQTVQGCAQGNRTAIEEIQTLVDTWHRTSETVKDHVIDFFEATNILNPVYMMAFSGARGNVSQVRQLVGMRGLMADPKGDIIGYAIRSNFREGLTLTEYMISAYGARKGVVDTALRTADAGYLTRRLVDVAQHIIVQQGSCGTQRGILLRPIKDGDKIVLKVQDRLLGRVLARDLYIDGEKIASRNEAIDHGLAYDITNAPRSKNANAPLDIFVRSPLTCGLNDGICQLCYGWSFTQNRLVPIGEAVGVMAGQSIGEPGTQLTMRTFHTGGVFTGEVQGEFRAPHEGTVHYPKPFPGVLVRTPYGQIAFLAKEAGSFIIHDEVQSKKTVLKIPAHTALFLREGEPVLGNQLLGLPGGLDGQGNDKVETRKLVFSNFDGEVVYQNVARKDMPFPEKYSDKLRREERDEKERNKRPFLAKQRAEKYRLKKRYTLSARVGTLWILAGQQIDLVYKNLPLFQGSGHLVEANTVLSRHAVATETEGFVCREKKRQAQQKPSCATQAHVLLPPQSQYQLDQDIDESAIVKTIEHSSTFSADETVIYQPRIHLPYSKGSFNTLKDTFALQSKNGEIFVIPDYTQQLGTPEKRHKIKYQTYDTPNRLRNDLYPWTQDLGWQNANARKHLEIFYFEPGYKNKQDGVFVWHQKVFMAPSCQHGLLFLIPCSFYEIDAQWRLSQNTPKIGKFGDFASWQHENSADLLHKKGTPPQVQNRKASPLPAYKLCKQIVWIQESTPIGHEAYKGLTDSEERENKLIRAAVSKAGICTITSFIEAKPALQTHPVVKFRVYEKNKSTKNFPGNPRAKDQSFVETAITTSFPFHPNPRKPQHTILEHQPGWFYLPPPSSIKTKSPFERLPEFHGERVSRKPFFMVMKCFENTLKYGKTTNNLYKKISKTNETRYESTGVENVTALVQKSILKDIRFSSLLRHPRIIHLIKQKSDEVKRLITGHIVISNTKNLNYPIFGIYQAWPKNAKQKTNGRFIQSKFGYIFDALTGSKTNLNQQIPLNRVNKKRTHLLGFGLLYQIMTEFSLDRIQNTLQKLENNDNFELSPRFTQQKISGPINVDTITEQTNIYTIFQATHSGSSASKLPTVVHKKFATNTFWSKQVPSRLVPNEQFRKASILPFLLPNATYLNKGEFLCRFFIQFESTLEKTGHWKLNWTPPWQKEASGVIDQTITLNFAKRPFLHTKDDEIFHPPSTWLTYEDPFVRRRQYIAKKGEVFRTLSNDCVLIEEKDKQTFAFSKPMSLSRLAIGDILRFGDEIEPGIGIPIAGQVIYMTPTHLTIRKGQPILFYNLGSIHVKPHQCISKGHPLVTLSYQRLITGDIVQGIPKVEQLFEAQARDKETEVKLTRFLLKTFRRLQAKVPSKQAFDESMSMIQHKIIENIQKVYLSQGVNIADIHFELIIRRMTSWGKIRHVGHTGLFRHEIMPLYRIEKVNAGTEGEKAVYEPVIVGISASALNAESFLSAASFQETSRVLARDAIEGKIDFLLGIKERVIAGDLIPAGTGFSEHIAYIAKQPKHF